MRSTLSQLPSKVPMSGANRAAVRSGAVLQRKCACAHTGATCPRCASSRSPLDYRAHRVFVDDAPASVLSTISSPGRPLEANTRDFMEARFGRPFGDVRIHTDSAASTSARDVDAAAYTVGNHVAFASGTYRPHTEDGQRLLAHELAHVVQQGRGAANRPGHAEERDADRAAEQVARHDGEVSVARSSATGLSRQDPRHTRGHGGEQTMGFNLYRKEDGWIFIEGPSGSAGHGVTTKGFDGIAYNERLDELHLLDNKSLKTPGNVSSATAIDPAKNLGKNLDAAIQRVQAMRDTKSRIRILQLLREQKRALDTGTPPPRQVRLIVTGEGGRSTGVSGPLAGRGVQFRGSPTPGSTGTPSGSSGGPPGSGPTAGGPTSPGTTTSAPAVRVNRPSPSVPPPTTSARVALEVEGAIGELAAEVRQAQRITTLIKTGTALFSAALEAIAAINSITEAQSILAEGTIFGDAQRSAEKLEGQAASIETDAEARWDAVPLIGLAVLTDRLEGANDAERLGDLGNECSTYASQLDDAIQQLAPMAAMTRARAEAANKLSDMLLKAAEIPQGIGTVQQSSEFTMSISLQKLGGALGAAATHFEQGLMFLTYLDDGLRAVAKKANSAYWAIVFRNMTKAMADAEKQKPAATSSAPGPQAHTPPPGQAPLPTREERDKQIHDAMTKPGHCPGGCHDRPQDTVPLEKKLGPLMKFDEDAVKRFLESDTRP